MHSKNGFLFDCLREDWSLSKEVFIPYFPYVPTGSDTTLFIIFICFVPKQKERPVAGWLRVQIFLVIGHWQSKWSIVSGAVCHIGQMGEIEGRDC